MIFFATVQSKNAPSEDEGDDESNPDEVDVEDDKGLEIRTMNPCIYLLYQVVFFTCATIISLGKLVCMINQ